MTDQPWAPGAATGVGSLPLEDPMEAARLVFGELPDLPHLPELPARGAGADMIGRTAGLLVDIAVDLQPAGWRVTDRPGYDSRRAVSFLRHDLDAVEEIGAGLAGPFKVQVAGPMTLAASLERPRGDRVLADHGARRDLAQSLAEGVAVHVAEVRRRLADATVLLQVDEPSLPAVLAGALPTASGFGRLRAVQQPEAEQAIGAVFAAAGAYGVVHCCASAVPIGVLRAAGAQAVSFDLALVAAAELDSYAEGVDAGLALWVGAVPSVGGSANETADAVARRVSGFWQRLGFDEGRAATQTVVTPACGLAGADAVWTRHALGLVREAGRKLAGSGG